jgi:DNA-binding response OmpR family regulator
VTSDLLSQQDRRKKILFVHDEPDLTNMLKMALEGVGFSIDIFNDPVMALETRPYDAKNEWI